MTKYKNLGFGILYLIMTLLLIYNAFTKPSSIYRDLIIPLVFLMSIIYFYMFLKEHKK